MLYKNMKRTELEAELKAAGEDTELVNRIQTAYNEEKSLKKAYYLNSFRASRSPSHP